MKEAEREIEVDFDLDLAGRNDSANAAYFQSSFARLMALQNSAHCRSLDSSFYRNESAESDAACDYMPGCDPIFANISKSANVSSAKLYAESFKNRTLTSDKHHHQYEVFKSTPHSLGDSSCRLNDSIGEQQPLLSWAEEVERDEALQSFPSELRSILSPGARGLGETTRKRENTITPNEPTKRIRNSTESAPSTEDDLDDILLIEADELEDVYSVSSDSSHDSVWPDRSEESNSVKATETKDETVVEEEISRLKAECQSLTEENKKLHLLSLQNSNVSLLQSQLESLQWQLKQTESSRQMYRAVMEQVSKFLERVHKNLDIISSKMSTSPKAKMSRFPRSRSVHTMAGMSATSNGSSSRCSSPSPTHFSSTLTSNSTRLTADFSTGDQINDSNVSSTQDSLESTFKEYTWKPSRPAAPEHVTLEKLSQESFRFYRTVQSLLNTREPDIIHRLTPAVSEVTLPDANEKIDNNSVGSCISLFQAGSVGMRKSLDTSSSCSTQFAMAEELESVGLSLPIQKDGSSAKPACVAEDESGFSSMSSFQDANILPEMKAYPKLGLPIINCQEPKHRRWTSTPVDKMYDSNVSINFCNSNEILPVLWV